MTASPSLHLSAGIDFKHCLDNKKRPGKNTDPAAKMVSMVPGDLSEWQKVQRCNLVLEIRRSVPPSLYMKEQNNKSVSRTARADLYSGNSHEYTFGCT